MIGLPIRVLHYGLLIVLSLTIVASLKAVGIILVIAGAVALSYLISGGPSYTKWDTSDVLSNLRSGNAKSVLIEDKGSGALVTMQAESVEIARVPRRHR